MNIGQTILAGLILAACAVTGSFVLLYRAKRLRLSESTYGIKGPNLRLLATLIGALVGIGVALIGFYFAQQGGRAEIIQWIGRSAYVLIAGAGAGHLFILLRTFLLLRAEETAWQRRQGPGNGTLGQRRRESYELLKPRFPHYIDLKTRDDQLVDELIGVIGAPLINLRRDLSRIPFYGYLGTVCGILLMAQELGKINEATETFKVLASMATGLVLAFNTTLVALLTYLPLRKGADYLGQRLGDLEDHWTRWRNGQEDRR